MAKKKEEATAKAMPDALDYKLDGSIPIPVFKAKHRETGDVVLVDPRTFDEELHELI